MLEKQRTIKNPVSLSGVGLHTGNKSNMTFKPAPEDFGIRFKRIDLENSPEIPADIDHVIDISRGTTIAKDGAEVHTVEHVLAAVVGCQIDNILVELDSNEPPIMDGSAKDYVETLNKSGFVEQNANKDYLIIEDTVHYHDEENNVDIVAVPLKDGFRVSVMVDYNNPALGVQHSGLFSMDEFAKEFAPSRTFCFLHEIEMLKAQGLIKGGDINNAIVIVDRDFPEEEFDSLKEKLGIQDSVILGSNGILNDKELRFKNEPARHKLLDLIGDLALIGAPVKCQILAARPGHKSNVEFTKILRKLYLQKKIEKKFQVLKSSSGIPLDIEAIMKIMPHRYPFLLVDRVLEIDYGKRIVGLKNVTINEPFFNGHFPTRPIMPGVLMIEAMAQCGGMLLLNTLDKPETKLVLFTTIDKAKFRKTVTPGDQLIFEVELVDFRRNICRIKGKGYKNYLGGELACEAEMMAAIVDK